ncbi:biotin--[acetyl-CoA-carboxylase] ligase [Francisella sp. LA112445]|uniref:biotin--[acetyl-CoA-carboxylase] ligase n=1 Tax=Francisella sp. LA112445 TaxID=1395624 RepID=UPI001788DE95|nr:biotin--[acetyl-CoA-carboxylase] ligase [Francisella sp. LA112445]QIW09734.1 biotin--[acetyl-CoA-carboxylase] ligase [Francisella sp. LA112445]
MKNHKYIEQNLAEQIDDINIEYFETIGSTNDYLLEKEFTSKYHFCYADIQTKARGRRGDKWISEDKDNIYATLGFHCDFNISGDSLKSIKIALGVLQAIQKYILPEQQKYLKIKLPNDIYFKDQKLAGILIETKNIKKDNFDIIIGVGINVNMFNLNENIDREWTSLAIINNQQVDSSQLMVSLVKQIVSLFDMSDEKALVELSKYDYTLGKKITFTYDNQLIKGTAKGISKELKLNILSDDNKFFEFDLANVSKIRVVK